MRAWLLVFLVACHTPKKHYGKFDGIERALPIVIVQGRAEIVGQVDRVRWYRLEPAAGTAEVTFVLEREGDDAWAQFFDDKRERLEPTEVSQEGEGFDNGEEIEEAPDDGDVTTVFRPPPPVIIVKIFGHARFALHVTQK